MSSDFAYETLYSEMNIIICHLMHFLIAKNIHKKSEFSYFI